MHMRTILSVLLFAFVGTVSFAEDQEPATISGIQALVINADSIEVFRDPASVLRLGDGDRSLAKDEVTRHGSFYLSDRRGIRSTYKLIGIEDKVAILEQTRWIHFPDRSEPDIRTLHVRSYDLRSPQMRLRETKMVHVDNATEIWRLEWLTRPQPACMPPDPAWFTCPCSGFEFGQSGRVAVVRSRAGQDIDRLEISDYFSGDFSAAQGEAILPYKPLKPSDLDFVEDRTLAAQIQRRPTAKVMFFADYDHDGHATEFVLQTSAQPCGKHNGVAIGVSSAEPKLHVFASIEHPDQPLELPLQLWDELRTSAGPHRMVTWRCGDHASDVESELEVEATPRGFRAVQRDFDCTDDDKRGA